MTSLARKIPGSSAALRLMGALLMMLWLIGCQSSSSGPGAARAAAAAAVVAPAIDQRTYRAAVLDNGLRVLVVSDPNADKAAAALSVFRGSLDDTLPGIAHFLEHMLFLGTDQFPDADEYHDFISRHGGSDNAYTATDHTNYFFNIGPEWFEPALKRFSRFFIAPTLDPQWVERERHAVNSEFQLQKQVDGWRRQAVRRTLFRDDHPGRRFSIGNLDTLQDQPNRTLRQALVDFYEANYSADQMALVLIAPKSADDLVDMARRLFREVPNRQIGPAVRSPNLFNRERLPALLGWQPEKDNRSVAFLFPTPPPHPAWRNRPLDYLANLLGHEGEGSLHQHLKARGWIDSLAAGSNDLDPNTGWFEVSMQLTPEGLDHVQEIGTALFSTIGLISRGGIQQWRQQENARLADLAFNYQEPVAEGRYAPYLAANMVRFPTVDALRAPYAMDRWDPVQIRSFLDALNPANVAVELVSQDTIPDSQTRWFQVPYRLQQIPQSWLQRWQNAAPDAELALPESNPFVPGALALVDSAPRPGPPQPMRISNTPAAELWHGTDTSFRVPRTSVVVKFRSGSGAQSAADQVARLVYAQLVGDALNSWSYPALLAGLSFSLTSHPEGFQLAVGGYNERQPLLLEQVLTEFAYYQVDAERFEIRRAELARQLRNRALDRPDQQVRAATGRLLQTRSWEPQRLATVADRLTVGALAGWRERFFRQLAVTTLVWGNTTADNARRINRQIARTVGNLRPLDPAPRQTLRLPGQRSLNILAIDHPDSSMALYVQGRTDSIAERARYGLLASMLGSDYFADLRTRKKFGYVVSAGPRIFRRTPGLAFVVQSPSVPLHALVDATSTFMRDWCAALPTVSDTILAQHRDGLLSSLNQRDRNLSGRAYRLWHELETGFPQFDSRAQLSAAIARTGRTDLQATCDQVLVDLDTRSLLTGSEGRFRNLTGLPTGTAIDPATFKRGLQRFAP